MNEQKNKPPRILVVDDLVENTLILEGFLEPKGFEVTVTHNGEAALRSVEESLPDMILLDLMMPGMNGFEVCRRLKQDPRTRHIPVIVLTGMSDRESNVKAVEAGADDFLHKPFDSALLDARIRSSLRSKALQDQIILYQRQLEESNEDLERRVLERTAQLNRTQLVVVFSLAKLAESRDTETGEHLERMRSYARELALQLLTCPSYQGVITEAFVSELYQSCPLHDIGKVGIPDQILLKPGKLSKDEFDVMKTHATIGGDTLKAADLEAGGNSFLTMGRDIAYFHHEKWDGSGYPHGLKGTDIPLPARICALADVYDALTSKRPYKEAMSHEKSKAIILEGRGIHFDSDIVDAFLAREQDFIRIRTSYQDYGRPSKLQEVIQQLEEKTAPGPGGVA